MTRVPYSLHFPLSTDLFKIPFKVLVRARVLPVLVPPASTRTRSSTSTITVASYKPATVLSRRYVASCIAVLQLQTSFNTQNSVLNADSSWDLQKENWLLLLKWVSTVWCQLV